MALLALAGIGAGLFGGVGCSAPDAPSGSSTTTTPAGPADPAATAVALPTCPSGQMARAGSTSCVPVGPIDAPEGFASSAPAWGFHAVLPAANTCLPTERAAIGSATCLPIDDCNAPFPPANAKVVVRAAGPAGPGVVTDLQAAMDAAAPGDTIAIDEGTYPGVVASQDLNLVGRCAAKVIFQAKAADDRGVGVDAGHKLGVRSISFHGFGFGVWAGSNGTTVTLESSIFTGSGAAAWITSGATLNVRNTLVDGTSAAGSMADGFIIARGGHATVSDTELRSVHVALDVFGMGSQATATRVVASERSLEDSSLFIASEGAAVDVDHTRIEASDKFLGVVEAIDQRDPGAHTPATMHVSSSELVRTHPTDAAGFDITGGSTFELTDSTLAYRARIAISAEEASNVSLVRSVIRPVSADDYKTVAVGSGLVINDGVHLSLASSAILGAAQSAVLASKGCQIKMADSLIADTFEFARKDLRTRIGTGQAISLSGNAVLDMTNSTLENNAGVSIWMGPEGSSVKLARSAVLSTQSADTANALAGLVALSGTLEITDSLFHGIPDTALVLDQATGLVAGTVISQGSVGFRLPGSTTLVDTADDTQQPNDGEVLSRKNVLVDVATAQATDALALGTCRCSTR